MDIFRRLFGPAQLPPTLHGYQAPPGALATGWSCDDPECGGGGWFPDPRPAIPRRCGLCGSGTHPHHAWPWQHDERRAELDALLHRAEHEGDVHRAPLTRLYLMCWTFEDHLMRRDRATALTSLAEADARLRREMKENRHLTEGSFRLLLVLGALRSGDPDIALTVLEPWVTLAHAQAPGYGTDLARDNASRTNYRSLVSSCLDWLDDPRTTTHRARPTVTAWALTTARAPHVRDYLTAQHLDRLSQLT
ncbi:hypothetical protein [Streptomyces sp. LaPpAH-108]|uniref:hypothetical protein n=1 Tax=Streptomyces sp. LaPpAH-108 TaxID=1155714 RepID=UPI00036B9A98|nr:hypothetical protein [Streptomyces sp. LaPpAH-108]